MFRDVWFLQGNLFLSVRFRAMDSDAMNSSHAVSTEVDTPEQVLEMFDSVSYEKVLVFVNVQHCNVRILQKHVKMVKVLVISYW